MMCTYTLIILSRQCIPIHCRDNCIATHCNYLYLFIILEKKTKTEQMFHIQFI